MLKFGFISELDVAKGLVRVHFTDDDIVSSPLPVSVQASKEDKYSFPFAINEQVWCVMDANCEFGVVGGAIYSGKDKPDGSVSTQSIDINIGVNKLQLKVSKSSGNLELTVAGDINIEANGNVTVKASVINAEAQTSATVKANDVTIDASTTTVTGTLDVNGAMTAASLETTGDVKAGGGIKSLMTHTHTDSIGGSTSTPI